MRSGRIARRACPREGKSLEKLLNGLKSINMKICYVAMGALFFLMAMTTIDVVSRKLMGFRGILDSLDMTELGLVLIIFCGFAYLESENGHIRVDMFVNMFPPLLKKIVEFVTLLGGAAILFMLFYSLFGNIATTYASGSATQMLHIPKWPFVLISAVGIIFYTITVFLHAIDILIKKPSRKAEDDAEAG